MACGLNKVQACMYTVVDHLLPVDPVFLFEISVEPRLDVLSDRLPALIVVDEVTKPGGVDDGETETNAALLNI